MIRTSRQLKALISNQAKGDSGKSTVEKIIAVPVDDNIHFEIKNVTEIMDDAEYSGVRLSLDAHLDTMRIPL